MKHLFLLEMNKIILGTDMKKRLIAVRAFDRKFFWEYENSSGPVAQKRCFLNKSLICSKCLAALVLIHY